MNDERLIRHVLGMSLNDLHDWYNTLSEDEIEYVKAVLSKRIETNCYKISAFSDEPIHDVSQASEYLKKFTIS